MTYIDIAILAIIGVAAIIGFARGMFKTVLSLFGTLVCLVLAWLLTTLLLDKLLELQFINKLVFGDTGSIYSWIKGWLPAFENLTVGTASEDAIKTAMDGVWSLLAPVIYKSVEALNSTGEYFGMPLQDCVAHIFAKGIAFVICFLFLFIILKIIVMIVTGIINAIRKSSVLRSLDRLLGFVLGGVSGALFVAVAFAVMSFFISADFMTPVRVELEKSVIAQPVSTYVGSFIEENINVEALTGGLVPNKPDAHEMLPAETTAANTLNVFGKLEMFQQSKYPRTSFTAGNYDQATQILVDEIDTFLNQAIRHVQEGDYVMEIEKIQEYAYEIEQIYTGTLEAQLNSYNTMKEAEDTDGASAVLVEIKTTLTTIKTKYTEYFIGESKIANISFTA